MNNTEHNTRAKAWTKKADELYAKIVGKLKNIDDIHDVINYGLAMQGKGFETAFDCFACSSSSAN